VFIWISNGISFVMEKNKCLYTDYFVIYIISNYDITRCL